MVKESCPGPSRRDCIRLGAAALFGLPITAEGILRAADAKSATGKGDVSLIFVFLHGGMSTIDTFDMKPDAPAEFRGEFRSIAAKTSGLRVCEHLPRVARETR